MKAKRSKKKKRKKKNVPQWFPSVEPIHNKYYFIYSLADSYVPGSVLGIWDTAVNKIVNKLCLMDFILITNYT